MSCVSRCLPVVCAVQDVKIRTGIVTMGGCVGSDGDRQDRQLPESPSLEQVVYCLK